MGRRLTTLLPLLLAAILAWPPLVSGWGGWEHEVTGHIALSCISPEVRARIRELVGPDAEVGEICIWADRIKRQRRHTARWHYINYPLERERPDYDPRTRPISNILAALEDQCAVLADSGEKKKDRADAVKFIAHFTGDLHQPLHCARGEDRGGNTIEVLFAGEKTNFHAVWDTRLTPRRELSPRRAALLIWSASSPSERQELSTGTIEDWMAESHILARDFAYPLLARAQAAAGENQIPELDGAYSLAAGPVVEKQLLKAGIRLGVLLERALAPSRPEEQPRQESTNFANFSN